MTAYWSQFNKQEIDSMHGIEPEDYDDETNVDYDEDETETEKHCCGNCMDCLGMSWRDFM